MRRSKKKKNSKSVRLWLLAAALTLSALPAAAHPDGGVSASRWYAGLEGGVPFAAATFSSFGADKTRWGYSLGAFGGYRFSPVLSLEASVKWGKTTLSARQCCINSGYWLGSDGVHYEAPVLGLDGWGYEELESSVAIQRYGLRLNVNALGLFASTKGSRWTLGLSPEISVVGTKATVKEAYPQSSSEEKELELKGFEKWHLGLGGTINDGYRVTFHLGVGVYTGLTFLTGKRIDGMPDRLHKANLVWESGARLSWSFGCKRKKTTADSYVQTPVETAGPARKAKPLTEKPLAETEEETTQAPVEEKTDTAVAVMPTKETEAEETVSEAKDTLPTVYFRFNSVKMPYGELRKVDTIAAMMKADADMRITIDGWCNTSGTKAANRRISLRRAQAVKRALMRRGIPAKRIAGVKGNGSEVKVLAPYDSFTLPMEQKPCRSWLWPTG